MEATLLLLPGSLEPQLRLSVAPSLKWLAIYGTSGAFTVNGREQLTRYLKWENEPLGEVREDAREKVLEN
jgi:hypothetical protein